MLRQAGQRDFLSHEGLSEVVGTILNSRDPTVCKYRTRQNFVGSVLTPTASSVDMFPPPPEAVTELMEGLVTDHRIMLERNVLPVAHAAAVAYGMVYIHPFMDGNGRTHRFLLHNILAQLGVITDGIIFPISSHSLKEHELYLKALTDWSRHIVALTDWDWGPGGTLEVRQDNAPLFRYIDMTT